MTKKEQHLDAKERILKAADELFYKQGYRKTGVNQLIAEAKVAKASFYSSFSSKKSLLKAYLKQRHKVWFGDLHQIVDAYDNPEKKIYGLFEYLEIWVTRTEFRGCAFININTELPDDSGEISSIVQEHKLQLRNTIDQITNELEQSDKTEKDIKLLSDTIYLMFEGAIVESQNYRSIWPVHRSLQAVKQLV